jgi:radical SAM protein with 4Fe4S-binding SPASM domain
MDLKDASITKLGFWDLDGRNRFDNLMETLKQFLKDIWNDRHELKTPMFRRSPFKHLWYRFQWHLRPALKWPSKYPLAVDVELAKSCNFRCTFCQQSTGWWNKEKVTVEESLMPWETFTKTVDQAVKLGVYSMKVNWRGEPMMNPNLGSYIRYMKSVGIHEVQMNTNASYITEENSKELIESGLDRIIFSCDGISRETYNKLRVGGDFNKFMENLRIFNDVRWLYKRMGKQVPVIRINMSIQKGNAHEIPMARKFFATLSDEIRFNSVYSPQSEKEEKRKVKRHGCPQIYQRLIVSSEGDTVPCCVDFRKKLNLGNVEKVSLREAYVTKVQAIRDKHEKHEGRELDGCAKCDNFAISEMKEGKVVYA